MPLLSRPAASGTWRSKPSSQLGSSAIVGTVDELWRLFSFQAFAKSELDYLDAALGPQVAADDVLADLRDRYKVAIPHIDDFVQHSCQAAAWYSWKKMDRKLGRRCRTARSPSVEASGEVGAEQLQRSPIATFIGSLGRMYAAVCEALQLEPDQVLMVGDTLAHDVEGPRAFGMHAIHLTRGARSSNPGTSIQSLSDLDALLAA